MSTSREINTLSFIGIISIFIINLGMLMGCEESKTLADYNCDKEFQTQYDLCISRQPKGTGRYTWMVHCEEMTIAIYCQERESNSKEEQIIEQPDSTEASKKLMKNYHGEYNGKKVECLNGVLYYSMESYDKDKLSPVYQASSKPRLVLCREDD